MNSTTPGSACPRIGISTEHWVKGSSFIKVEEALRKSQAIGFKALTIPVQIPSNMQDRGPQRIRQLAADANIKLYVQYKLQYDSKNNCDQELETIYHPDPTVVQKALDRLLEALEVTEQLGSDYMGGILYSWKWEESQRHIHWDEEDYEEKRAARHLAERVARRNLEGALQKLALAAREKGISVGVQDPPPYAFQKGRNFLGFDRDPNLKVHFLCNQSSYDYQIGYAKRALLLRCGENIGYVAFERKSLNPRKRSDTDSADAGFFQALRDISYNGPVIAVPSMAVPSVECLPPSAKKVMEQLEGDGQTQAIDCLLFLSFQLRQDIDAKARSNILQYTQLETPTTTS